MKTKKKASTNTKLFQTALAAFILVLAVLLIKQLPQQSTEPLHTTRRGQIVTSEKIEISGVEVNDFFKRAPETGSPSYTTIVRTKDYHVFYFPPDELFVISITSYPFDEHRPIAEQEFLKNLGINEDEACGLNVDITTPSFANPDRAGEIYGLSFCE